MPDERYRSECTEIGRAAYEVQNNIALTVTARYITIIYIVLRLGTSAVYIIPISSFFRHRGLAAQEREQMCEFHRLIEEQIPRLRRYARALTRNRERADDLVQDTLGRALKQGTILATRH